jgi:hypothetical protein
MKKINNNTIINIFIFIFVFIFSYILNITNIIIGNVGENPGELIQGATLGSPDNFWYINQVKNFMKGYGFTSDPNDLIQYVRRTPGYPIFYGIHFVIFGEFFAHRIITFSQCLIFTFSAITLGKIATLISKSSRLGQITSLVYGTSPYLISFLFLTITEAISPAFVIFTVYIYLKALCSENKKYIYFFIAGMFISISTLIRPTNGILLISSIIILFILKYNFREIIKLSLCILIGFMVLITPWTIRNYLIIGHFIPLETFQIQVPYDGQGLKSRGLNSWYRAWAAHDMLKIHYGIKADLKSNNKYKTINDFIENETPPQIYVGYGKEELRNLFIDYQKCIEIDLNRNRGVKLNWGEKIDDCEYKVDMQFLEYAELIKKSNPVLSYVIAPFFLRGSQYIFHSGMHTFKSMQGNKLNSAIFIFKTIAYIINVSLWFLFVIFMFSKINYKLKISLGSFVILSFIFITYNSHVEGRYLISTYPFLYLSGLLYINNLINEKRYKR